MVDALEQYSVDGLVAVLLALLNVVQTLALAVMADRSRRVRRSERRETGPPTN